MRRKHKPGPHCFPSPTPKSDPANLHWTAYVLTLWDSKWCWGFLFVFFVLIFEIGSHFLFLILLGMGMCAFNPSIQEAEVLWDNVDYWIYFYWGRQSSVNLRSAWFTVRLFKKETEKDFLFLSYVHECLPTSKSVHHVCTPLLEVRRGHWTPWN